MSEIASRVTTLLTDGADLDAIATSLRRHARFGAVLSLSVALIAVTVGLFLPRWYTSGASLTVDSGPSLGASAGMLGIASQLGIASVGGQSSPLFYGDLLQSRAVQDRILNAALPVGEDGKPSSLLVVWGKSAAPTARSWAAARRKLNAHLTTSVNARTGVIAFSVDGPNASAAKLMADTALSALNDVIVALRRQRATSERRFLEARWTDAGDSVRVHEAALRAFYERNRIAQSPSLQFEEARLRRDIERLASVYSQLGTQLEQARIQEIRDTPAVGIIDSPIEPDRKSSPHLSTLAIVGLLLGVVVSVVLAL
ncbi:MAG: GNVR domain-containing protein, partial [Gemmatimonadaceae bacterium]